jgi:hypothetical protein
MFWVAFLAFLMSSCATPKINVVSKRSLNLSDGVLARHGSLCVLTNSKIQETFASEKDTALTKVAENYFQLKGYKIQDLPPGADYGFMILVSMSQGPVAGATMVDNEALFKRYYTYEMLGALYALKPNGGPGELLWRGEAYQIITNVDSLAGDDILLQRILEKFPN